MAWSTREVAELAGTSLRAVRHYHEVGLLDEPERTSNGYKQYGVSHLVRLLRITRLTDLGFSLTQIAEMGDADEHPAGALRTLDAELAATIERLQRARVELAAILRNSTPTDLPAGVGLATSGANLTDNDRSFVTVMSRVLGPEALEAYAEVIADPPVPTDEDFENLAPDADEATREALADRLLPQIRDIVRSHPELTSPSPNSARALNAMKVAMTELYNPAQVDVMARVSKRL